MGDGLEEEDEDIEDTELQRIPNRDINVGDNEVQAIGNQLELSSQLSMPNSIMHTSPVRSNRRQRTTKGKIIS